MKKVISLFLVMALLTGVLAVSFNALSVSDEGLISAAEAIAAYEAETGEELETQRIYFQMPNGNSGPVAEEDVIVHHPEEIDPDTGLIVKDAYDEVAIHAGEKAPSWYSDYNIVDGKNYAGFYWWGGTLNTDGAWCGYRMEIADYDQGIYYVDVPSDVVIGIFNNGVDGGTDSSAPIYYEAAQTVDTNIEGLYEFEEDDTLPYGSPNPDSFNECICIVDPNQITINEYSGMQTCGDHWYAYYGNGCYGSEFGPNDYDSADYPDGTPGWSEDMQDVCLNPDHFVNGVHVGAHGGDDPTEPAPTEPATEPAPTEPPHEHTPGDAVIENRVAPYTTADGTGSYDTVVYCTECGEEVSRETTQTSLTLDPNTLYFDATGSGWSLSAKGETVAFHILGGDLGTEGNNTGLSWGGKKAQGTLVSTADGIWSFNPSAKGITLNPGVQYKIIFVRYKSGFDSTCQTYDLFFTTDCLGHIAYLNGSEYENPVDSSKKAKVAVWYGMDASVYGPVLQISSIGNVLGTVPEEGKTPVSIFTDFLTVVDSTTELTKYQNAYHYVVDAGKKTEQQMIDDIGEGLGLTKGDVYLAFTSNDIETAWDHTVSTLPGEITPPTEPATEVETQPATEPHVHTPGDPVQENYVAASCTAEGSYDEVVYCSVCGEEISREHKTIEMTKHTLKRVNGKAATETEDGWISHYECTVCGKYFADATGTREVTWEQIRKPATGTPTQAPTDPPTQAPTDPPATEPPTEPPVTGILGDIDNDGAVTIIDVTVIQRVEAEIIKPCTHEMLVRGDVDKSGEVDIVDATRIQRWLLDIEEGLGIGKALS